MRRRSREPKLQLSAKEKRIVLFYAVLLVMIMVVGVYLGVLQAKHLGAR